MMQGKVVGDLLMGTEVMEIGPFHYLKKLLKNPQGYQVKKPIQICLHCLSWWKLGSLLQKG